jgi:hypothetical protein
MKKILSLLMLFVLVVPATMAVTTKETIDLGPFIASFEIDNPKGSYEITINDPIQLSDHNSYWFRVDSTTRMENIDVYIDDYGTPVDVSMSELMTRLIEENQRSGINVTCLPSPIGGRPGALAEIADEKTGKIYSYDALFSPDGVGNRGSVIAEIMSTYPKNTTNAFMSKLKINRA